MPGLSGWAKIAEIIGSIAVVASLIFVGLEPLDRSGFRNDL
jgi:hypothetical protein